MNIEHVKQLVHLAGFELSEYDMLQFCKENEVWLQNADEYKDTYTLFHKLSRYEKFVKRKRAEEFRIFFNSLKRKPHYRRNYTTV